MKTFAEYRKHDEDNIHDIFENTEFFENFFEYTTVTRLDEGATKITPQPWGNVKTKVEAEEAYITASALAQAGKRELNRKLKKIIPGGRGGKLLIDIKTKNAFVDKIIGRKKPSATIFDVLRSAILVKSKGEVDRVVKAIKKTFKYSEAEEKTKGSDTEFGYHGSWHFTVFVAGMWAEIQIMTRKLWSFKDEAHKIYNKYRSKTASDTDDDENIEKLDKALSKQLFNLGNKPRGRRSNKKRRR